MSQTNIEVEGGELLLMSKEGHYAVIPARDRAKVNKMVEDKCDDCINKYIQSLPKESDYAKDGTLIETTGQPSRKKKVVVFAESPPISYSISEKIPEEEELLWNLQREYNEALDVEGLYDTAANELSHYFDGFFGEEKINGKKYSDISTFENLFKEDNLENEQILLANLPEHAKDKYETTKELYKQRQNIPRVRNRIHAEFLKHNESVLGQYDKTFMTEAENVKNYYKNNEDYEVETYPFYQYDGVKKNPNLIGTEKIREIIQTLGPEDRVAIFGHSGARLGGILNKDLATMIENSAVEDCFLGTCSFEDRVGPYKETGKNIYYRPNTPWFGFNNRADNFIEGMFSRNQPQGERDVIITDVKEGSEYMLYSPENSRIKIN